MKFEKNKDEMENVIDISVYDETDNTKFPQ